MKGPETQKCHTRRMNQGFYFAFMQGQGLDIGYRGDIKDADPVLPTAIGVDLDYPGYDGTHLPFADNSKSYVFSSHCLEHTDNYKEHIREYHRVVKVGGYIIIAVPHKYLYEKKEELPSRFNGDHKRLYTSASLLKEIEDSLLPNSFRIRYLYENDEGHDYLDSPEIHSKGFYEIEIVIQKLNEKYNWKKI